MSKGFFAALNYCHSAAFESQCSRYQFECRGNGECIAIYNACDGIPQCSDGSDEAPELYCPTITGTTHPKTFHEQLKSLKDINENLPQPEKVPESAMSSESASKIKQHPIKSTTSVRQYQSSGSMGYFPYGYSQQNEQIGEASHAKIETPQQVPNQPRYYGREGELLQYPMNNGQWQGYQAQHQEEGNLIFNHKGNALVPEASDSHYTAPYSNEMSHSDYLKYAANNGYYSGSGPMYYAGPNGWPQRLPQQPHSLEDLPQRPLLSMYGNGMSGSAPSDYYYEDSQLRNRFPFVPQDPRRIQNSDNQQNVPVKESEKQETFRETSKQEQPKKTESVKKVLDNVTSTSIRTSAKVETTTIGVFKKEEKPPGIAEHLKMNEGDLDGVNERPSGAILSLTLGMCITAIMITLVGCRLRVVRKRMRRNNKSPYAHDADFLVNGMYL